MVTALPTLKERMLRAFGHTGLRGTWRIIDLLAPRYGTPRATKTTFIGRDYVSDLSDMIDRHIFYFGAYSPGELDFLGHCTDKLATSGDVNFFDVGANVGQHSLFMSPRVSSVHAFEPSHLCADRFKANALLGGHDNITIHRIALATADGSAVLGSGFSGNTGSRSLNWSLPGGATEAVQVRSAGPYFAEQRLPKMSILKLDVEGHEKQVLRALKGRLAEDRPVIMVELIGKDTKGGFASQQEFADVLYPRHVLRSLTEVRRKFRVFPFSWDHECAVVIPAEQAERILA
jgi:FkbM family methyltransferase